jgi:hypothetical protein
VQRWNIEATSAPLWPDGLVLRRTANDAVYAWVLAHARARPLDRDSVDRGVVQSVRDRKGRIINCVVADGSERCERNAGGWPVLPLGKRTLTLPQNPDAVTASGYTNLEVWLHSMSAALERAELCGAKSRAAHQSARAVKARQALDRPARLAL